MTINTYANYVAAEYRAAARKGEAITIEQAFERALGYAPTTRTAEQILNTAEWRLGLAA